MAAIMLGLPMLQRASSTFIAKAVAAQHFGLSGFGVNSTGKTSVNGMPLHKPSTSSNCLLLTRSFASGRMRLQKSISSQEMFIGSSNQLIQPHIPPIHHPPLFSLRGLVSRWAVLRSSLTSFLATSAIKASMKQRGEKWVRQDFLALSTKLYHSINIALIRGDARALRGLVTEETLTKFDRQLKLAQQSGNQLHWSSEMKPPKITGVRYARTSLGEKIAEFAQVTVHFKGKQTIREQGLPPKHSPVNEYWVFERALLQKESKWRLFHQAQPRS